MAGATAFDRVDGQGWAEMGEAFGAGATVGAAAGGSTWVPDRRLFWPTWVTATIAATSAADGVGMAGGAGAIAVWSGRQRAG
jgi:hypothetical protein